ncbi:MAG: HAD-IA family hydrolase [Pseudoruegeria sp.]
MIAPLRLAIFDVDGTLVDSQKLIVASMKAAFDAVGLDCPARSEILGVVGLSLPIAIEGVCPEATPGQLDRMVEAYKIAYTTERLDDRLSSPFFPGARKALDDLWEVPEVLLGVATGKSRRGLDLLIEAHDLNGRFVTQQTADHHPSKPHPSMVLTALSEVGIDAANAVMIGDTSFDMEMGRAAGVRCVGVSWGYHDPDRLRASGADVIVDDFEALPSVLWG